MMFVRVVKRRLRDDVALDFKLLESYRPAAGSAAEAQIPEELDYQAE